MVIKKQFVLFISIFFLSLSILAQPSKLEKLIDKAYSIVEGDSAKPRNNYFVTIPIWGIYPETGWRLGLSNIYFFKTNVDSITRPSLARVNLQFTQNNQFSIRPFVDLFSKNNQYNLKMFYNFTDFNEYFYGIGNQVIKADRELYNFRLNQLDIRFTKLIKPKLYAGMQTHVEKMNNVSYSKENGILNNTSVPGYNGSYTAGLGFVLAYDNRDKIFFPLNGSYLELSNVLYHAAFTSNYNFNSVVIDARKYKQLYKYNVLAFQFYSKLNFGEAPFRQMATMGNDAIMRGYYNGHFRDNYLYAMQAELRQTIWGPVGFAAFVGGGNVGKNAQDLLGSIKPNYGIGLRGVAIRKEHVNIRIDYGRGENGISGFYFTMGEAF